MTDEFLNSLVAEGVVTRRGKSGAVLSIDFRDASQAGREIKFDEHLANLLKYDRIRELYLNQIQFTNADLVLAQLARTLLRLQILDLQQTNVTESGISLLVGSENLAMLFLSKDQVSHEFLADFRKRMIKTRVIVS